ncbi:MAG: hypothetical protein D0528_04115 [Methylococcales bacterium]|nr:MAG: hypothetical protein D0528_04115 [Methylococcales bacterium]
MGGVLELFVFMVIIATAAFAPLGYFIYKYTNKNAQPFGDTEPHGDSHSFVNDMAETVIHFVKSKLGKK